MTSCALCRLRKVKCDKGRPTCQRCRVSGQDCRYTKKRKPGPAKGRNMKLQEKVQGLETSLQLLSNKVQQHVTGPTETREAYQSNVSNSNRCSTEAHDAQLPWVGSNPQTTRDIHRREPSDERRQGQPGFGHSHLEDGADWTPPWAASLPPYPLLVDLVNLYFRYVNTWLPILREESIAKLLGEIQAGRLAEPDEILLHAIAVSGLRFSEEPENMKHLYLKLSKMRVYTHIVGNADVRSLQAVTILTVEALGDGDVTQAMNLLALLSHNLLRLGLCAESRFQLGYFQDTPAGLSQRSGISPGHGWMQDEENRRLFWGAYTIDRCISTCSSSLFKINERNVSRPLPCRYDLWNSGRPSTTRWYRKDLPFDMADNAPDNLGSFSYFCEVARIMSRIDEFVKQPLDICRSEDVNKWKTEYVKLDKQLSLWLSSLPHEYQHIAESCRSDTSCMVSGWITLQSGFILAAIRLHSAAAYPPIVSPLLQSSPEAVKKCTTVVASIRRTAEDVMSTGMSRFIGPLLLTAVWVTARFLLVEASALNQETDASLVSFMSFFDELGKHWPISKSFSTTITRLLSHGHESGIARSLDYFRKYFSRALSIL